MVLLRLSRIWKDGLCIETEPGLPNMAGSGIDGAPPEKDTVKANCATAAGPGMQSVHQEDGTDGCSSVADTVGSHLVENVQAIVQQR